MKGSNANVTPRLAAMAEAAFKSSISTRSRTFCEIRAAVEREIHNAGYGRYRMDRGIGSELTERENDISAFFVLNRAPKFVHVHYKF